MTVLGIIGLVLSFFIGALIGVAVAPGNPIVWVGIGLGLALFYLLASVKVVFEYERGIVFRVGKFASLAEPGLNLLLPIVETLQKVSTRIQVADVPPQEIISRDNVPININAVAYYKVEDPIKAILDVENFRAATFQIAQTTLRSVVGQHEMDQVLIHRDQLNATLQEIIDKETDAWGIKVNLVEIKDVELPQNLKRAMAKQAEAERERRARIILATGELEASEKLALAGKKMTDDPGALQIRMIQAMQEISVEKNSTILFPYPFEIGNIFKKLFDGKST